MGDIIFRPMASQRDAEAFRALNEEWITSLFAMEEKDHITLGDPQGVIIDRGGDVLMAEMDGEVVGVAAWIAFPDATFELSKMAVSPAVRGRGVGRRLLTYAVERARGRGAKVLFLGSSTKLKDAVHLYESVGFRHVQPGELPEMKYSRADVFMKMDLNKGPGA